VFVEGAVREGTLYGNLYLKGSGDPKLVAERLWLLLRRVQGLGIQNIAGDIVLDRSAFEVAPVDAASFDGEPLRPYNASPEALLVNYKSVVMTFVPDRTANIATVQFEPPLAGVQFQTRVPLLPEKNKGNGDCGDYRAALRADFANPARISFAGGYPASCGENVWPVAYVDPLSFSARAVEGLWREMGGKLLGTVREGRVPEVTAAFEVVSPPLAEVIRDINKYSNNVMAQQLFLTLSLNGATSNGTVSSGEAATLAKSQEVLRQWWTDRIGRDDAPSVGNGSGLSREDRISAQALARLLQSAYRSPLMPELMSSLPITGVDGTLKNRRSAAQGSAHLKTGSLRDVTAVAGYVLGASGKRYALVAVVNHPNANAARPALDALVAWAVRDN
jgi:D-alanyl-D-alanine carboxypeptidase/D-alanyl-D-alanine-endopeptidase (penicillin-binding protein 4)